VPSRPSPESNTGSSALQQLQKPPLLSRTLRHSSAASQGANVTHLQASKKPASRLGNSYLVLINREIKTSVQRCLVWTSFLNNITNLLGFSQPSLLSGDIQSTTPMQITYFHTIINELVVVNDMESYETYQIAVDTGSVQRVRGRVSITVTVHVNRKSDDLSVGTPQLKVWTHLLTSFL